MLEFVLDVTVADTEDDVSDMLDEETALLEDMVEDMLDDTEELLMVAFFGNGNSLIGGSTFVHSVSLLMMLTPRRLSRTYAGA
jgi:hypothetical protein